MTDIVERLAAIYREYKKGEFRWHDLRANNMVQNDVEGCYTFFWFPNNGRWDFWKWTVQYQHPVHADGLTYTDEPVKYYILHEFHETYGQILRIPEPDDGRHYHDDPPDGFFGPEIINRYGRFRYAFDDLATAKAVIGPELGHIIYPHLYLLSDKEMEEWNDFRTGFDGGIQ